MTIYLTLFLIARWAVKILWTRQVLLNNAPNASEKAIDNTYKRTWKDKGKNSQISCNFRWSFGHLLKIYIEKQKNGNYMSYLPIWINELKAYELFANITTYVA